VAERSKGWVCSRSLAGFLISNPAGGMESVSCECCVLSSRGLLRRAGHSSRGFLPSVVSLSVIAKPQE